MTENRDKWRKYDDGVANPRIEQNFFPVSRVDTAIVFARYLCIYFKNIVMLTVVCSFEMNTLICVLTRSMSPFQQRCPSFETRLVSREKCWSLSRSQRGIVRYAVLCHKCFVQAVRFSNDQSVTSVLIYLP